MKIPWISIPYLCIIAYAVFLFFTANKCQLGMDEFYTGPYNVTRELGEIRARLQSLRNTLPMAFSSPNISYEHIEKILAEHNKQQDKSIEAIAKHYPEESSGLLKDFVTYKKELREARLRVAKITDGNENPDFAIAQYTSQIVPPLNRINNILNQLAHKADMEGNAIRKGFESRHFALRIFASILGILVLLLLFYTEYRDKNRKKVIKNRDKLLSLLSENVDDVFIVADEDKKIEYVSANSDRMLKLPFRKIRENPAALYERLGHAGIWLKQRLADVKKQEVQEIDTELDYGTKKVKICIFPINTSGIYNRHIVVISDRTDAYIKERALADALENSRMASAAKSDFLAHMSHEIRTPLNVIIGMTTIALSKKDDPAKVEDNLEKIGQSSRHLLGLINDVLDMSKIENGKLSINKELFNLRICLENIVTIIHPQTESRQQHFEVAATGVDVENLTGDALRLNQILINLLSNATKFTPNGGNILLKIEQSDIKENRVWLTFTISDNGIGMKPEFQKKLFQPFEQAVPCVAAKFGGSGLGLAITKNLVSLMGGVITLKSQENEGTEFRVEIPFELPAENLETTPQKMDSRKILVVDDDPITCEHACHLLQSIGMQADAAAGGEEALEKIKKDMATDQPYEICFVDWQMPEMNGEKTVRKIRSLAGDSISIIIISAFDSTAIIEPATNAGASSFIAKPFFASSLKDAILSVTSASKNETEEKKRNFAGKKVLLVEDNEFNTEISTEFLQMANAHVDHAANGQEAVDKFNKSKPFYYDLVLMDIQMPVMNGYDATSAIRKLERPDAKNIPILAMTANAFNEDIAQAFAAGMNDHISKPINITELYDKMNYWLYEIVKHAKCKPAQ